MLMSRKVQGRVRSIKDEISRLESIIPDLVPNDRCSCSWGTQFEEAARKAAEYLRERLEGLYAELRALSQ